MPYYVCIQWPSDRDPRLPRPTMYLAAGPYATQVEAAAVSQELREEKKQRWGSDLGQFFVRTEDDICSQRSSGAADIQFRSYRKLRIPDCFEIYKDGGGRVSNLTFYPDGTWSHD